MAKKSIAQKISDRFVDRLITKFVNKVIDTGLGVGNFLISENLRQIEDKRLKNNKVKNEVVVLQGEDKDVK